MSRPALPIVLALVVLAGCNGLPSGLGNLGTTKTPTPTATATPSPTPTASPTPSPTPEFDATIYFESCSDILVDADQYDVVTLYYEASYQRFTAGYSGSTTFEPTGNHTGKVVWEVTVTQGDQSVLRTNPTLQACQPTPTPTPTATPTPSPTPTAEQGLDTFSYEDPQSEEYDVITRITNNNDYPVQVRVTTRFLNESNATLAIVENTYDIEAGQRTKFQHDYPHTDDWRVERHTQTFNATRV